MTCTVEDPSSSVSPSFSPSLSLPDSDGEKNKSTNVINTSTQYSMPHFPVNNLMNGSSLLTSTSSQSSNTSISESISSNGNSSSFHFPREISIIALTFIIFAFIGICCTSLMNRTFRRKKEYFILS